MIMLNDELILQHGYKEYPVPVFDEYVSKFFQKRFDNDEGKKYYIDIKRWDFPSHIQPHQSYEFSCQFMYKDKPINMTLFGNQWEIEQAEAWVEKMWRLMECDYYERWENC